MNFTNVNGTLFFTANVGPDGFEMWKSDGTATGTYKLKDFKFVPFSNPDRQQNHVPLKLVAVGNTLFFTANNTGVSYDLWKTDGTVSGTIEVKKGINVAQAPINISRIAPELVNVNGILYFFSDSGKQLWKSDGTAAGTVLVKDGFINDNFINEAYIYHPLMLTSSGGNLYFTYGSKANGRELWKSDGTAAGTVLVKDITSGSDYFLGSTNFRNLHDLNGELYFVISLNVGNTIKNELWKSNGTAAGTALVKDLGPSVNFYDPYVESIQSVSNILYFTIKNTSYGNELWKSDGTAIGTKIVRDILPGPASSSPGQLTNANGVLYFVVKNEKKDTKLWKTNGSSQGTVNVR
jgi:ELWxxDGT repeat protein